MDSHCDRFEIDGMKMVKLGKLACRGTSSFPRLTPAPCSSHAILAGTTFVTMEIRDLPAQCYMFSLVTFASLRVPGLDYVPP